MKKTSLLTILKEKDFPQYLRFIKKMDIGKITEEEETEFFKTAPEDWRYNYICVTYPRVAAEKCLMLNGTLETLKKTYELWGFWEENVNWLFLSAGHETCKKVLSCITNRPSAEAEVLMLKRNSRELLTMWLNKYHCLSDEGEKLINEDFSLYQLKNFYIDQQLEEQRKMDPN